MHLILKVLISQLTLRTGFEQPGTGSFAVEPRSHESDNKQTKLILLLKFACNTDLRSKNWLHDQ